MKRDGIGECETCAEHMSITRRLAEIRDAAPVAVGRVAEIVVDNPGQIAIIIAAAMVAAQAAGNIVRPRNLVQAAALALVLQAGMGKLTAAAIDRGWLNFRIRGDDGELISLRDA
jgi:hypothetical protein